jgi:hypothetical protein
MRGLKRPFADELFDGWYLPVSTQIPYPGTLEVNGMLESQAGVVADFPVPGRSTNSPVMLRFPRFGEPDFGEARRLVQNFRVTDVTPPADLDEEQSREERRKLYLNGVAWLLRMWECQEINASLSCDPVPLLPEGPAQPGDPAPSGRVGQPMEFTMLLAQNGKCSAGGVIVSNRLAPHLEFVSSELIPKSDVADTNSVRVLPATNHVQLRLSEFPWGAVFGWHTVAIPRRGGWMTNEYTLTRGIYSASSCQQVFYVEGAACDGPVRLEARLGAGGKLQLTIFGGAGCAFELETSDTVTPWTPTLTVPLEPNADPYVHLLDRPGQTRFYRLRRSP